MNCKVMLTYHTPACMFNVSKNQLSRQAGSRNLTGPKTLPTIWHTYMKLVTKYQISAINSCWEKCNEKYLRTDGRTDGGKTVYPPPADERMMMPGLYHTYLFEFYSGSTSEDIKKNYGPGAYNEETLFSSKKWPYKRSVLYWGVTFSSVLLYQFIWNLAW